MRNVIEVGRKSVSDLTSNQYYGGLNRRFERRAAVLRRFGFKYRCVAEGVAVFDRARFVKVQTITAAEVMHADGRAWRAALAMRLARPVVM